ncbi:MAG TPA: (2Fe-2S)-binding protein, partial [Fusibacter sp.]|nr:(2Fe-2S)-binding protein [Fusibacter sp.]
ENYDTDMTTLKELLSQKLLQIEGLTMEDDITYFTGIRAATYKEDFIVEQSKQLVNFIHVAGIQSPGFASAPGIAERVASIVSGCAMAVFEMPLCRKEGWNPIRKAIPELANMTLDERQKWIESKRDYGEIICRCEEISKGEIIDALSSPIPVDTVDGVKRRVRAGMGRCQGGFCMPLVMEIIHEVKGIPTESITKKSGASKIAVHETKHREVV